METTTLPQREIKFRGKRVSDGGWVYGSLINNAFVKSATKAPCIYILPSNLDDFKDECDYYFDCFDDIAMWIDNFEVIPETVGQLATKVKRENGELGEIFEGDLIVHGERVLYVTTSGGNTILVGKNNDTAILLSFNNGKVKVGNIHDNHELLTV